MIQKAETTSLQLCQDLPHEFIKIFDYIMNLEGSLDPDYAYIEVLFQLAAEKNQIKIDWVFDWYDIVEKEK